MDRLNRFKRLVVALVITLLLAARLSALALADTSPDPGPTPSLALCKIDNSLRAPDLEFLKKKYLALCLDHQIRLMKKQEELYQVTIDNNRKAQAQINDISALQSGVYGDQLWENKLVFALVIVIVVCGLVFSGMQFMQAKRHHDERIRATSSLSDMPEAPEYMQDVMKLDSFEVRATTLGVSILSLSTLFFFLYLEFVYKVAATSTGG